MKYDLPRKRKKKAKSFFDARSPNGYLGMRIANEVLCEENRQRKPRYVEYGKDLKPKRYF